MVIKVYADHYPVWTDESKAAAQEQYRVFLENLKLILKSESVILGSPTFYFVEIRMCFASILWWGGGGLLYLGYLLEGWRSGVLLDTCDYCKGRFLLTGFGGSILSGSNGFWGVCRDCGREGEGRRAEGSVFRARTNWAVDMRKAHPRFRQEWQEHDGFKFSFAEPGLVPARKKELIKIDLGQPVSLEDLLQRLKKG